MLSKSATLILGLIAEKPINPYEITKFTDYISVENWLPIPAQSVYSAIKSLYGKGYIVGQNVKDGNMPEKKIYSITETGNKQLIYSLEEFLGNTQWDFAKFNIAVIMICHLQKDKASQILKDKISYLERKKISLDKNLEEFKSNSATGIHAIRHMAYLTSVEIVSTKEFLDVVQNNSDWNYFLSLDTQRKNDGKDVL